MRLIKLSILWGVLLLFFDVYSVKNGIEHQDLMSASESFEQIDNIEDKIKALEERSQEIMSRAESLGDKLLLVVALQQGIIELMLMESKEKAKAFALNEDLHNKKEAILNIKLSGSQELLDLVKRQYDESNQRHDKFLIYCKKQDGQQGIIIERAKKFSFYEGCFAGGSFLAIGTWLYLAIKNRRSLLKKVV